MVRAIRLGDESQFVGQSCALCKQAFEPGDDIVICPEDGARHHVHCWQANGDRCTAYGCRGAGAVVAGRPIVTGASQPSAGSPQVIEDPRQPNGRPAAPRPRIIEQPPETPQANRTTPPPPPAHVPIGRTGSADGPPPGSKVRVLPQRTTGCAGSCLVFFIILAVLMLGASCFGLYTLFTTVIERVGTAGPALPSAEVALTFVPSLLSLL